MTFLAARAAAHLRQDRPVSRPSVRLLGMLSAAKRTVLCQSSDDMWVFINNKLVVNLGGIHGVSSASVNLTQLAANMSLSTNNYPVDIFFAHRGSNSTPALQIQLNANTLCNALSSGVAVLNFPYFNSTSSLVLLGQAAISLPGVPSNITRLVNSQTTGSSAGPSSPPVTTVSMPVCVFSVVRQYRQRSDHGRARAVPERLQLHIWLPHSIRRERQCRGVRVRAARQWWLCARQQWRRPGLRRNRQLHRIRVRYNAADTVQRSAPTTHFDPHRLQRI